MSGGRATISMGGTRRTGGRSKSDKTADSLPSLRSRPEPGTALCMALLALAIFLGGGGTGNPETEIVLQVLSACLIIPMVASSKWQRGLGPVPGVAWFIAGLVLLMPIAQLVPLPPSLWRALPGRAVEIQSLALIQADQSWMPLTMAPARTFASLLAMTFPVLVMLQASRLSLQGRIWLCGVIVTAGLLSLLLGALQLSHTGGWDWSIYSYFNEGFLVGFQANRNAEADILLIAMLALGVLASARLSDGRHHGMTWTGLHMSLIAFMVGMVMTGSRTGISLGAVMLLFLVAMLWPLLRRRSGGLRWAGGAFAALALAGVLALQLQSVQKVVDRFFFTKDARFDIWADTSYAIGQVWPFGSGIGTIVPMLVAAERLEVVDTRMPVRAHNDWLEWVLEGGAPGLAVLGAVILLVGYVAVRALITASRSDAAPNRRAQVIFACGLLVIVALHSIVDYPLRSMSIATLTALAVAFFLEPAALQRSRH